MSGKAIEVVMQGTWLYAGEVLCDVRIVRTDFRPGTGDYEDPPEIENDQEGEFYDIEYGSPTMRGHYPSGGGGFDSLAEAVAHVAVATNGTIVWDQDLGWAEVRARNRESDI